MADGQKPCAAYPPDRKKTAMAVDASIIEQIQGKDVAALGDNIPDEVRNKTPEQLRELIEVLDAHLRSLHQNEHGELRDLTDAEDKAFAYGLKVREIAMKRIEEHRAVAEVFTRRPAAVKLAYSNIRHGLDDVAGVVRMTNSEARDAALRILDDRGSASHLRSDEKDEVDALVRRSTDVARRIVVTENDAYRSAFAKLTTRVDGHMFLDEDERNAMRAWDEYRAASLTSAAGGYGVPVFIDPSIIMTAQGSGNPFLELCDQVDVNTNTWKGVSSAGVSWSFDTEAAEVSDDAPTLAQPTISINMARGFIPFSIEIGQDYTSFASEMQRLLMEGYDELLVDKFTRGSGTGEPTGILTALSANATVRVGVQTSGANFGAQDPYTVWKAVPQRFRRKASWLMSVDVNNKLRQLGTANVFHAYSVNLPTEWADQFFGKQTYESPYMPDTTTSTSANSGLAVVGDFRAGYKIARRAGMQIELIPHMFHTSTNLPRGQRGWFAWARLGANSVNDLAFRLLVNTA
jgi:HK97 family phage major capsid protein